MRSALVVERQIATKTATRLRDASVGPEVDFLVFDRPLEPLAKDSVELGFLAALCGPRGRTTTYLLRSDCPSHLSLHLANHFLGAPFACSRCARIILFA